MRKDKVKCDYCKFDQSCSKKYENHIYFKGCNDFTKKTGLGLFMQTAIDNLCGLKEPYKE